MTNNLLRFVKLNNKNFQKLNKALKPSSLVPKLHKNIDSKAFSNSRSNVMRISADLKEAPTKSFEKFQVTWKTFGPNVSFSRN